MKGDRDTVADHAHVVVTTVIQLTEDKNCLCNKTIQKTFRKTTMFFLELKKLVFLTFLKKYYD